MEKKIIFWFAEWFVLSLITVTIGSIFTLFLPNQSTEIDVLISVLIGIIYAPTAIQRYEKKFPK